jgi:hypothetical protein
MICKTPLPGRALCEQKQSDHYGTYSTNWIPMQTCETVSGLQHYHKGSHLFIIHRLLFITAYLTPHCFINGIGDSTIYRASLSPS